MVILIIGFILLLSSIAEGATRLGLHVTQEELNIWRARMTDTTTTMNGYTMQQIYQARILPDANAFRGQGHPGGDGRWLGYTGAGCVPNDSSGPGAAPKPTIVSGNSYGRGAGAQMARSAFVFLLTGDVSYADPVKAELLNQITQSGTNFANAAKWCPTGSDGISHQNIIETTPWVYRLLLAYDYLLAGGYTGFNATEKTNIQNWFRDAANLFHLGHSTGVNGGPYKGIYSTPQNFICTGTPCTAAGSLLYFGGPTIRNATARFHNIGTMPPMFSMAYGLLTGNATHVANARAWIMGFLRVGMWDNGTFEDYRRWADCPDTCPGSAWSHAGGAWGPMTAAIDMLARTGDTSLYTFTGPNLTLNSAGSTIGWQTALDLAARLANKTTSLYGTSVAGDVNASNLITWDTDTPDKGQYYDFSSLAANIFYKNTAITTAMQRNLLAGNNPSTGCYDDQFGGCFSGVWAWWPDLPFMYGKLQGVINPYITVPTVPDFASNMEMHLTFDDNTGTSANDSTVNNHDGTLETGASWGTAKIGTSAVALDGSATSAVTVVGGLTNPVSATLTAWVFPTGWPTTNNDVINLRNGIILRLLNSGSVRGSFRGPTGYIGISVDAGIPLNAWTHIAYTITPSDQRIYVNGVMVGSGNDPSTVNYTGLSANTLIGNHPTDTTNFRFQGRIDDARVYTRALTSEDINSLVSYNPGVPLSVHIATPTSNESYATTTSPLINLAGDASDDVGVTSIIRTCPTCTPTSEAATCTPACGAATTATSFHFAPIPLSIGVNEITVVATDAVGSQTDRITVTYTPPPVVGGCNYYAASTGLAGNNGTSPGAPFRVIDFWSRAIPGNVLCLLDADGSVEKPAYTGGNSMIQPPSSLQGTSSAPITIKAVNDGGVLIDGQNARNPVVLGATNEWFVVEGVNARNGLTSVYEFLGANNQGKRLVGWNATSGQLNATIFTVRSANSVIEDCAGWGDNARVILQGSGTISAPESGYRRCFCEWNDHPEGGFTAGACAAPGVDQRFENIIGTMNRTGQ